jgi:hypothetical protein
MSIPIKPDMADRIQVSNETSRPETSRPAKRDWRLIGGGALVVALAVVAVAMLFGEPERDAPDSAPVPLIRAEKGPDKVRPEDPGGMEVPNRDMLVYRRFEGAGEAPAVERLLPSTEQPVVPPRPVAAPGREVPPVDERPEMALAPPPAEEILAKRVEIEIEDVEAEAAPEPMEAPAEGPASAPREPAAPTPSPPPAPAAAPAHGAAGAYQVQLVAVRTQDQARASWGQLSKKHADVLGGLSPNIVRADLGAKGVIYRLRAGPAGDEGQARALCASLAKRKVDCLVVRPSG